ncbi:MAG: 16S rRNA (adenine(1518)-N(6)/adenine(1519)-N(6))-dimethyltransferase RsmA [Thermoplasmatota archaeon]
MGARLGQHFLKDPRVLADILAAASLQPGERVLEVGPGRGFLTRALAACGPNLVAIEADPFLARELVLEGIPRLEVVTGDAVRVDLRAGGRWDAIVANLPYLISGPFTAALFDLLVEPATRWGRAVLMYQKEFALRLLATTASPEYGRLSVHARRWCEVTRVRDVAAGCFDPPPRVESMVLKLTPHPVPPFEVADEKVWRAVVDGSFLHRRKQLGNSLPPAVAGFGIDRTAALGALTALGWSNLRPENLEAHQFAALANALAGRAP